MNKKQNMGVFISLVVLLLCGLSIVWYVLRKKQKKPNVLLILVDDLNMVVNGYGYYTDSIYPNLTPNISGLMNKGVSFSNAHCTEPSCAPSRVSLLTGFYPHRSGQYTFSAYRENQYLSDVVNIFTHFKNNGYKTYSAGKVFHGTKDENPDDYTDFGGSANYGPYSAKDGKFAYHPALLVPDSGNLDFVHSFAPLSDIPSKYQGYTGWIKADGSPFHYESDLHRDKTPDENTVDWIIGKLVEDHENPFFMAAGIVRPHTPMYAPQKYFDKFPIETIIVPPDLKKDASNRMKSFTERNPYRPNKGVEMYWNATGGYDSDEDGLKRFIQAYLACTAFMDDQVGAIINSLNKSKYRDNTIVVFASDNGFHFGEREWLFKYSYWNESTNIPLTIVIPGNKHKKQFITDPVSLVDIYPTLIELCKLPKNPNEHIPNRELNGISLVPYLMGDDKPNENRPSYAITSFDHDFLDVMYYTIVTNKFRYCLSSLGEEELYHRINDPGETNNIADELIWANEKTVLKKLIEEEINQ